MKFAIFSDGFDYEKSSMVTYQFLCYVKEKLLRLRFLSSLYENQRNSCNRIFYVQINNIL